MAGYRLADGGGAACVEKRHTPHAQNHDPRGAADAPQRVEQLVSNPEKDRPFDPEHFDAIGQGFALIDFSSHCAAPARSDFANAVMARPT